MSTFLLDSKEALKRLQAFSLDRLQSDQAKPMLDRTRSLYRFMCKALEEFCSETYSMASSSGSVASGNEPTHLLTHLLTHSLTYS